jgi:NTP pyrophosphatase (non-canonical NTP hydrolase)
MNQLLVRIRAFRDARDWMKFYSPKNLVVSIVIESAELLEHFQWKDDKEAAAHVEKHLEKIADEIADVAIYLLELSDNLGIDLEDAVSNKLNKNEKRYPVQKSHGVATKYTDL